MSKPIYKWEAIRDVGNNLKDKKLLTSHDAKASRLLTATLHVLILLNSHYHPKPKYKILHFTPAKLSNSPADGATSAIGEKFRVAGMPVEDCGRVAEVCR